MSKSVDNANEFKAHQGDRLGDFEADVIRGELQRNDLSIGFLFDLWSRMPAPHEFHPAPTATHYGAPAVNEALAGPQGVHDNLGVANELREAEVQTLEQMYSGGKPDEMDLKLADFYRKAVDEAYENA